MFDRVKPCKTCPFRTNENGLRHLGYDRRKLVGQDEVFDDFDDWIECQSEDD